MTEFAKSVRNAMPLTPRAESLILALLCTLFAAQLFLSARQLSQVADEPTHLYAGYRYLKCGDLGYSSEHTPLAKIVAALPLLPMNLAVDCSPFEGKEIKVTLSAQAWLYNQNWSEALTRARLAISIFAAGLCLLVWIAARRMFNFATAVVATVLLIFDPNVLAYGPLVMTDVAVTCMMLLALFSFYLWVRQRTASLLLLTGLATGLALLTKHSALVILPAFCVLAVADAVIPSTTPSRLASRAALRNLAAVALICVVAFAVVWLGYGVRFAAHPGKVLFDNPLPPTASISARALHAAQHYRLLPEAYLHGFATAVSISDRPGPAFLAGSVYPRPPWFSVPFYLLIRNTPAMLALLLLSALGLFVTLRERRRELLFLLIPAAILVAACARSSMAAGIRYLLPAFPFLFIAVAAGCAELTRRAHWARYAVFSLLALHALSSLHAYPNYLSYANEFWGGPANAYRYLPWVDTGQAYTEAKNFLEHHPAENCSLITGWHLDPQFYGVPCQTYGLYLPAQIPPRMSGTIIVSSSLLTDVRLPEQELVSPFKNAVPKTKIGGSALLVFNGDFDTRLAAAKTERDLTARAASAGQLADALQHCKRAVELAPASPQSHSFYCAVLAQTGQLAAALNECYTARNLLLQDPLREEPGRKESLSEIESWIAAAQAAARK